MKKERSLLLDILEPCDQRWDGMSVDADGRYCAHCTKVVTDFTRMSDAALLAHISRHGFSCGRFREDQLQREIALPVVRNSGLWSRILVTAGLFFLTQKAGAQTREDDGIGLKYEHADLKTPEIKRQPWPLPPLVTPPKTDFPQIGRFPDHIVMGYVVNYHPHILDYLHHDEDRPAPSRTTGVAAMIKNALRNKNRITDSGRLHAWISVFLKRDKS